MHKHKWVLDLLEYMMGKSIGGPWHCVVSIWVCECGLTKETREYLDAVR